MDRVRGDGEWLDQFAGRTSPVQVFSPDGRLIGVFTPAPVVGPSNGAEPTAAEMDEAERTCQRWYTGAELVAHLRSLG